MTVPLWLPTLSAGLLAAAAWVAWATWPSRIAAWWWAGTCALGAVAFGRRAAVELAPWSAPVVEPLAALCRSPWLLGAAVGGAVLGLSAAAWRLAAGRFPRAAWTPGSWATLATLALVGWWLAHDPRAALGLDAFLVYGPVNGVCLWVIGRAWALRAPVAAW